MEILFIYILAMAVCVVVGWRCAAWGTSAATAVAGVFCGMLVVGVVFLRKTSWLPDVLVCETVTLAERCWYAPFAAGLMLLGIRQSRLAALKQGKPTFAAGRMALMMVLIVSALFGAGLYGLVLSLIGPAQTLKEIAFTEPKTINGVVLQSTAYTCGPCVCATMLRMHGLDPEASERSMIPLCHTIVRGGSSMLSLAAALKLAVPEKKYRVRLLDPTLEELRTLPLPAIVSVNCGPWVGHVVVLCEIENERVRIADPADKDGLVWWKMSEFKKRYLGEAVTVER